MYAEDVTGGTVVLFDGSCGMCDAVVQWLLEHDREAALRYLSLQSPTAEQLIKRHPQLARIDSVIVVLHYQTPDEHVVFYSDAAVVLARIIGGGWRHAATVLRLIPRPLRDAGYKVVARYRYLVFGKITASCRILTPEQRKRFLPDSL